MFVHLKIHSGPENEHSNLTIFSEKFKKMNHAQIDKAMAFTPSSSAF